MGRTEAKEARGRVEGAVAREAAREADRAALWTPVAIGLGAALFFWLRDEPATWIGWAAAGGAAIAWAASRAIAAGAAGGGAGVRALLAALRALLAVGALAAVGFAAAQWRAGAVAAPVLERAGTYAVSGRVVETGADAQGRPRVVLDRLRIEGVAAAGTPGRARVRLAAAQPLGHRIALRARLAPPPSPAEPRAFDFRRAAWFQGLGAVGAARGAARDLGPGAIGAGLAGWMDRARLALARLRARLAADARARVAAAGWRGDEGAVIAALLYGERSGIAPDTVAALRGANLAHLLAISGLHMGLVCLTAFGIARLAAAPFPGLGARIDAKKWAAAVGLAVGAGYLALSGAALPTQRAFIMAAVAFGAILVDRPPVTLRALAAAATLILLARPESLFDAGFQLSFAATTAMVAFFEATRGFWRRPREGGPGWRRALGLWAAALAAASAVAGTATAPFAAAAFQRLARYGLLANLAAVPSMGLWIMPLGLLAVALTPFGAADPVYSAMAAGVAYVIRVAQGAAALPGAAVAIAAAPAGAVAAIALGGLWLCLWRGVWLRGLGAAAAAAGIWAWSAAERPEILISPGARMVGVLGAEGARAIDRPRADRYAAASWLRRDGSAPGAVAAPTFTWFRGGRVARTRSGWRVEVSLYPRLDGRDARRSCRGPTLLVAPRGDWVGQGAGAEGRTATQPPPLPGLLRVFPSTGASGRERGLLRSIAPPGRAGPCLLLDREALDATGAVAIWIEQARGAPRLRAETARGAAGRRLWTSAEARAARFSEQ